MSENPQSDIFTIGVGGAAGDGVKKAGIKIGAFLQSLGYQVYISFDYPSLIRGGHNFARISFSKNKIWNDHAKLDILIVSNEGSVEIHRGELKEGVKIISDIPLPKISEDPKVIFEGTNLAAFAESFGEPKGELIDGNTAFARGLQAAGLDFYLAYPMTPSTSILHYLASKQTKEGLKVIQPENEIAAINMALGMVYAGKRVAVGSATGGFALMQEAFSFTGMAELPLVVATGAPTHSSQSDLRFAIHSGHGEFPRIVITPGDPEESFKAGADAMNLAWKFQVPVIVLLDKILSEHMMTSAINTDSVLVEKNENMIFPGTPDKVVKVTSYEHDENGITTEKAEDIKRAVERRFAKLENIKSEMQNRETAKIYGDPTSENVVVFWGSTKAPVLEAAKYFNKPIKLVQIIWLEPFDAERVKRELEGNPAFAESYGGRRKIICVEGNRGGQLASLIREKTGIEITEKILKYDSQPFDPEVLAEEINKKVM